MNQGAHGAGVCTVVPGGLETSTHPGTCAPQTAHHKRHAVTKQIVHKVRIRSCNANCLTYAPSASGTALPYKISHQGCTHHVTKARPCRPRRAASTLGFHPHCVRIRIRMAATPDRPALSASAAPAMLHAKAQLQLALKKLPSTVPAIPPPAPLIVAWLCVCGGGSAGLLQDRTYFLEKVSLFPK